MDLLAISLTGSLKNGCWRLWDSMTSNLKPINRLKRRPLAVGKFAILNCQRMKEDPQ